MINEKEAIKPVGKKQKYGEKYFQIEKRDGKHKNHFFFRIGQ